MNSDVIGDLDEDHTLEGDNFDNGYDHEDNDTAENKYSTLGQTGRLRQAEMDATENSVRNAGWLDDSPNGLSHTHTQSIVPDVQQPGSQWKAAVQEKRDQVLAQRNKNISATKSMRKKPGHYTDPNENNVKVVDQAYLTHDYKAKTAAAQQLIDKVVHFFRLNTDQERAFRIIANHASSPQDDQLKMYLAGMGGTGKSQVFKAVMKLFNARNEAHRYVILGPTGTSAALLGGSTYHSFLGISPNSANARNEGVSIAQLKGRLEGVDYIFIDEVSMLSCQDMYRISSRLAKAMNEFDLPFGGINMIFAGDFAQLPPVGGSSLYSSSVGSVDSAMKPHLQEAAIGKALWHQITTVVILRENMRQISQTAEDNLFRTALVNMRYGACTPDDIKFLRTRIAGRHPDQPNVAAKEFRNVAIICGVHSQKDQINKLGCERFAADTHQTLTSFYSIDKWGKETDPAVKNKWGKTKAAPKLKHQSDAIEFDDQREIWKVRHGATDHFPGKLTLCVGMPVMIRNNDATELCITKGQEGFVVGWQSYRGPHGKRVLDTLFVELDKPPQQVQIPGLPKNVVPIIKSTKTVACVPK